MSDHLPIAKVFSKTFALNHSLMSISIRSVSIERHDVRTRMPFKYGIATMTDLPHCFIRVTADIDGADAQGISADHLPPKWFTKEPEKDPIDEIDEMLCVIEKAGQFAREIEEKSVFAFWKTLYDRQDAWAKQQNIPPLLANFGTSLIERALIDAFCRYREQPFHSLLLENAFGIQWDSIRTELAESSPKDLLPSRPLETLSIRHTVGLGDYIRESDIPESERLSDGLPQSLENCIRFYGTKDLKIKVNGKVDSDIERLQAIAKTFSELGIQDFAFSVDGNEQFKDVATFKSFWETLRSNNDSRSFLDALLFIEQPFHRDVALNDSIGDALKAWIDAPPIIIDESDGEIESMPRALELGYRGTSHKNCKGVFKGIINRAHINLLNRNCGKERHLMSGEDLCNIGPIANHQDCLVQASLGNASVERNGHHYFKGISVFDIQLQRNALRSFPQLYTQSDDGYVRLNIKNGQLPTKDLTATPFGTDDSHFGY
ncbi:hypothetical protein [Pelagicoccus mobilis]|uniref:Enolase C-terminal domain-containing protein n=1 Tax=Pelagicoccus mobilis TaxID=415221 RepID=A0A934RSD0_9BACT|nr:hypothetical protein [Pelagicoccus mobilis]MBK1875471.1 hypothetical protein [Pelagicoccus mobilis]